MFLVPLPFGNEVIKTKSKLKGDNSSNNAYNHLLLSPPLVPYQKKLMEFQQIVGYIEVLCHVPSYPIYHVFSRKEVCRQLIVGITLDGVCH
jgi:hypothetical protein